MNILRNLIILVFASFIVASCEKSNATPHKCGEKSQTQEQPAAAPSGMVQSSENTSVESARSSVIVEEPTTIEFSSAPTISGNPSSGDVSGSGDDDRDGGERRRKR